MEVVDFSRSFLVWRIDELKKPTQTVSAKPPYSLNTARVQVDATLRVAQHGTGLVEEFVLGASCKTERVGVERDVWLMPNADFIPVFSSVDFTYIKTYDHTGREVMYYPESRGPQPHRERIARPEAFDASEIVLTRSSAEPLDSADAIVDAVLAGNPLVCRTTLESERYTATLEYPAVTINANERDVVYQTDTGPVLLPDLTCDPEGLMDGLELAFAAFNGPNWVEFLVRVPVALRDDVTVYHFSESVRCDARNQVLRML